MTEFVNLNKSTGEMFKIIDEGDAFRLNDELFIKCDQGMAVGLGRTAIRTVDPGARVIPVKLTKVKYKDR